VTGLEICVDGVTGLEVAAAFPVARIELCGPLAVGGTTPSPGLLAAARHVPVPVYAMIRPRDGDFVFSPAEEEAMLADIEAVRRAGLAGVVLGAARPDGTLDKPMLRRLCAASKGLGCTLHRVFDLVPDKEEALETAIELGFERVLTSGGAPKALEGAAALAALVAQARGRIIVMAGSGVTADTVEELVARSGVPEVHASCRVPVPAEERQAALGFSAHGRTDASAIRALLSRLASPPS